jgi:hypothetical protein
MQTVRRRRTSWAVAASVAAHLGVLIAVLSQRPTLRIPVEPGGPPEAIIPLLILPRTPPPVAGQGPSPTPIQLHRRQRRSTPEASAVAPLVAPRARPVETQAPAAAPAAVRPSPQPAPPAEAVRATLRTTLGCTEARMAGLTQEDRANCLERLGRGAREAVYLPLALSPDKRALLDQAGAAKLAQKLAAERAAPSARTSPEPAD